MILLKKFVDIFKQYNNKRTKFKGEKVRFRGRIRVLTDDEILSDVENTTTLLYEETVAAGTIDTFYTNSYPIEAGQTFLASFSPAVGYPTDYSLYPSYAFTVYLLNLPEAEKQALSKTSHTLPIYTSTYEIDSDKVVAYGNAYYLGTEAKRGYMQPLESDNLMNFRRHGVMIKWDADVASGSYNCIAVGMNVMSDRFAGVSLFRGLEFNDPANGESEASGFMLRNGIKNADGSVVITAENEILLGDAVSPSTARKVLNLQTGVYTLLDSADARYDLPLLDARYSQLVYGNYLIYDNGSGLYYQEIGTKTATRFASYRIGACVYNGFLYTQYGDKLEAYDLSTFARSSANDLTIANLNMPSEFTASSSTYFLHISNIGSNYLVSFLRAFTNSNLNSYNGTAKTIICSDLGDIGNSIVDIVPNVNTALGIEIGGEYLFFNNVVPSAFTLNGQYTYTTKTGGTYTMKKKGVKFCRSGMYGNLFSFHTFDEPQAIPTGQALKLEYYYTFEE